VPICAASNNDLVQYVTELAGSTAKARAVAATKVTPARSAAR
jgi:hypothetical protein